MNPSSASVASSSESRAMQNVPHDAEASDIATSFFMSSCIFPH